MHEDIRQLLNNYLDGELQGIRLLQVQNHLANCAACREELRELRRVSELLQADPAPEMVPVERFLSNLSLSLPRRTMRDRPPRPGSLVWWAVPVFLIGGWFFLRTTFTLTSIISAAGMSGLFEQVTALFSTGDQQAIWITILGWLSGSSTIGVEASTLGILNTLDSFGGNLFNSFIGQAFIVLLYWLWLAVWWLKRRPRPMSLSTSSVHS